MDFTSRQCRKRAEDFARCPSSSLGVNCLQFGFCVPTIPAIDFPLSINPDWMTSLVQSRPEITLKDMVIPGSHDSGSYSIENFKVFSAVGRTQTVNVLDQLHRGSRYLDIRLENLLMVSMSFMGVYKVLNLNEFSKKLVLSVMTFLANLSLLRL